MVRTVCQAALLTVVNMHTWCVADDVPCRLDRSNSTDKYNRGRKSRARVCKMSWGIFPGIFRVHHVCLELISRNLYLNML